MIFTILIITFTKVKVALNNLVDEMVRFKSMIRNDSPNGLIFKCIE
jgi:hypothetical protein